MLGRGDWSVGDLGDGSLASPCTGQERSMAARVCVRQEQREAREEASLPLISLTSEVLPGGPGSRTSVLRLRPQEFSLHAHVEEKPCPRSLATSRGTPLTGDKVTE
jgi:hypothetical protein